MLCRQIHERLRRFERRSPLPVPEQAAGLASDVSDPRRRIGFIAPAAASDKAATSWWRAARQGNAHSFRPSEPFQAQMFDSRYEANEPGQE